MSNNVVYLKRSYSCEFCNPAWSPAPPPDTPPCTCYYPCEEYFCPARPALDNDDDSDDGDL